MQVGLCRAKLETNLPMTACELLLFFCQILLCFASHPLFFLIPLYLSSVAVCCSKCILLSSSSCLTPGLGGKYREECCRGDERRRRRRGATETEGGVHSSGILLGWSVFATPLVSTTDVNRRSDPEFQQRQSFPPHKFTTVLPTGTKPPSGKDVEGNT